MSRKSLLISLLATSLLAACAGPQQTRVLSQNNDISGVGMGLDSRDFSGAAQAAVQKLLNSGALDHPGGGRYVIMINRVTNDTMQRIDTDLLVKKIRVAVLNSGKAAISTAVSGDGAEDDMTMHIRQMRASQEFSQKNMAGAHAMALPELSLTGKILQNNTTVDNGQRVDYAFQLTLTDLKSGLAIWEDEEPLSKLGTDRTVAW